MGSHGNSCGNAAPENGAGAGPSRLPEAHGGGGVTGPAGTPSVPWPRRCPGLGTAGGAAGGPGGGGRRGQQETKPKLPGREGGTHGRDARQGCSGATPAAGIEGWGNIPAWVVGEKSSLGVSHSSGDLSCGKAPPSQEEKPWQLSSAAFPGEVNPRLSRSCAGTRAALTSRPRLHRAAEPGTERGQPRQSRPHPRKGQTPSRGAGRLPHPGAVGISRTGPRCPRRAQPLRLFIPCHPPAPARAAPAAKKILQEQEKENPLSRAGSELMTTNQRHPLLPFPSFPGRSGLCNPRQPAPRC